MNIAKTPENYRRIGLMGAAVVAILAALIMATTIFPFGSNTYTAELEHSAGLRVGEEVQVAGVGVGEIRKIELDGQHVKVEFTVDKDIDLGKNTTAEVKVATLLGTHFLLLSPAGNGELTHEHIPLAQTRVPSTSRTSSTRPATCRRSWTSTRSARHSTRWPRRWMPRVRSSSPR